MPTLAFAEFLIFLAITTLGYYGILYVENQVLYGIYFSFETLYDYTGWLSFGLLFVGLWLQNPYGKIFGILAFVAACWHGLIFLHLDFGFDWELIFQKIIAENHLIVGSISFFAMALVFFASLLKIFRKLYFSFIVYVAILFGVLHIIMLQKVLNGFYYAVLAITLCALVFKMRKFYWGRL